ncbi:MAG TPA: hypothetical protein VKA46_21050 [Gemmataceae bacterium]|nr:hypothetical protein [Gemmataceae bacterium]
MPRRDDESEGHEEAEEDRPRRRRRDENDDDRDDDKPRARREDEDEDEERARRRRRSLRDEDDEEEEERPRRPKKRRRRAAASADGSGPLDAMFANTNIVLLILFPVLCGIVALIFGIIGVATCRDSDAKTKAWIVLGISLAWIVIVGCTGFVGSPRRF